MGYFKALENNGSNNTFSKPVGKNKLDTYHTLFAKLYKTWAKSCQCQGKSTTKHMLIY